MNHLVIDVYRLKEISKLVRACWCSLSALCGGVAPPPACLTRRVFVLPAPGLVMPEKKSKEKGSRKLKRRGSEAQSEPSLVKQMKTEEAPPPQAS